MGMLARRLEPLGCALAASDTSACPLKPKKLPPSRCSRGKPGIGCRAMCPPLPVPRRPVILGQVTYT